MQYQNCNMIRQFATEDTVQEYLRNLEFEQSSDLKNMLKSAKHYVAAKKRFEDEQEVEDETQAQCLGSAVHALVLEGRKEYDKRYFFLRKDMLPYPDKDFKNKENKLRREILKDEAKSDGKVLITEKTSNTIEQMAGAIEKNPVAMSIMENTYRELSFYTTVDFDGLEVKCKVRPDAIHKNGFYYVSLKTTGQGEPDDYARLASGFHYEMTEAFYFRVLNNILPAGNKILAGFQIVVENDKPFCSMVYDISGAMCGYNHVSEFLAEIKNGTVNDNFQTILDSQEYNDRYDKFLKIGYDVYLSTAINRLRIYRENGIEYGYEIKSDRADGILQMKLPDYAVYKANNLII